MEMYDHFCGAVFTSAEAYHECAKTVLQNCADQNVHYVETSFHIGSLYAETMSGPDVISAVLMPLPKVSRFASSWACATMTTPAPERPSSTTAYTGSN